jgi:hypothetical protein
MMHSSVSIAFRTGRIAYGLDREKDPLRNVSARVISEIVRIGPRTIHMIF